MTNAEHRHVVQCLDYYGEKLGCKAEFDLAITEVVKFAKIKSIVDNWAVDDDEHELLEQIADIINEEERTNG